MNKDIHQKESNDGDKTNVENCYQGAVVIGGTFILSVRVDRDIQQPRKNINNKQRYSP